MSGFPDRGQSLTTKLYVFLFHVLWRCEKKVVRRAGCLKALGDVKAHKLSLREPVLEKATQALTMK